MARPDKQEKNGGKMSSVILFNFLSGYNQILGKKAPNYSDKSVLNVNFTISTPLYQKL